MTKSDISQCIKSLSAGVCIGLGGVAYINNMNNWYAPILFSIGLISVVLFDFTLYTGKIGYSMDKSINIHFMGYIRILLFNILGTYIVAKLAQYTSSVDISEMISIKLNTGYIETFILAIGCGMMMYLAVESYNKTKNIFMLIFPVVVFIVSKFDHCIASSFYYAYGNALFKTESILHIIVSILGNSLGSILLRKLHNT